ncbi:hypothetical protein HYQ45_014043 [Verticillium longisporum]|uniref:Uncharacterized protein n=1 Tax=Verticillium longisporum TaxID=100787 RepID=A0A8I2ZB74_VERLO|nr:hypothetical protein HYQ45_014043 [Verticillium longisporum]
MFGSMRKKHRQPAQPLTAATANPNAATAAAAVFGRQNSNASLSSAAAAAALRSRPTTPINVGEVQTKRTQRRSASVSSQNSQHDARRALHRTASQSSMTERTFRTPSPSPHRPVSSGAYDSPPPVPAIPEDMRSDNGRNTHKRATSLQTQPFRVASQKKQGGAGSWFGAATEGAAVNVRKSDALLSRTQPSESRPGARYVAPHRAQSVTSTHSSVASDQSLVYDPNSRRMVPKADLLTREYDIEPSEKPVKRKKKQQRQQQLALGRSGSHLAQGTVARARGTAVEGDESQVQTRSQAQAQAQIQPEVKTKPQPQRIVRTQPQSQRFVRPESPEPKTRQRHPQIEQPAPITTAAVTAAAAASGTGSRTPEPPHAQAPTTADRTVHVSDGTSAPIQAQQTDSAPPSGRAELEDQDSSEEDEEDEEEDLVDGATAHTESEPYGAEAVPVNTTRHSSPPSFSTSSTAVDSFADNVVSSAPPKQYGSVRSLREHSNSPVRNARFALRTDQLVVKHEPPARSVSPRKSALKNSSSPSRGASPSEDGSDLGLEHYASHQDDLPSNRKKSVRVSFDEHSTQVIGESAQEQHSDSPVVPSPQTARRPWYSNIGRNKKKDSVALDVDEVMQPRPALPSFGSVRDKKPKETEEERPLVRPVESKHSPAISASPAALPSSPDDEEIDDPIGHSTDGNLASILTRENAAKNEANISKFREPLPPVVTSMEGTGYHSPSSSCSDDEDGEGSPPTQETFLESIAEAPSEPALNPLDRTKEEETLVDNAERTNVGGTGATHLQVNTGRDLSQDAVPAIAIIEPSPGLQEPSVDGAGAGYFDVPGGFPEDDSDSNNVSRPAAVPTGREAEAKTAVAPIQIPTSSTNPSVDELEASPPNTPTARAPGVSTINEETESSGSSIYSDAYEDLSDAEGDGFLSLDAVLTTPVSQKVSKRLFEKALVGSSKEASKDDSIQRSDLFAASAPATEPLETQDDWDKAKLYWKSLTNDKRKQLEREAQEEAGVEADEEQVAHPKKTKKKRSSRASQVSKPIEQGPEQEAVQQRHGDAERNYQIKPGTKYASKDDAGVPSMRQSLRGTESQQGSGVGGSRLKKSMRASQPAATNVSEPTMRRTLRADPPETNGAHSRKAASQEVAQSNGNMRKSMRQNGNPQPSISQPEPAARKTGRPLSLQQAPTPRETGPNHKRQSSVDSPAAAAALATAQPSLRRRGSDSSESSFKRARPQKQAQGFGFRRSMRAASPERPVENKSSRFSLRSLSPVGRQNTASPPPTTAMSNRMSMRSTLRSESVDRGSSRMHMPSFGRSSGKKVAEKKNKNRYGDSSDEDAPGPSIFRSRFADSSDEDEPSAPPPAAGKMPKSLRNGGGASSSAAAAAMNLPTTRQRQDAAEFSEELSDSSDEDQAPPQRTPSGRLVRANSEGRGLQRKRSGRGELMESTTTPAVNSTESATRPGHTRRGSFFSVLRRRKDKDGAGKISRPEPREVLLGKARNSERSNSEISALRVNNSSPRLQKRQPANWPLPDTTARPATSGGPATGDSAPQPPFMKRRSISHTFGASNNHHLQQQEQLNGNVTPDLDEQSQAGGSVMKKKKFGKLRRMFGLND